MYEKDGKISFSGVSLPFSSMEDSANQRMQTAQVWAGHSMIRKKKETLFLRGEIIDNGETMNHIINQDLHIHTTYSTGDSAVEPQQTVSFIASLHHADIRGISDHFEYLQGSIFSEYQKELYDHGFYCGCEVNDSTDAQEAVKYPFDYYIYHCRDRVSEYRGAETLLETGKPVIISHPIAIGADLYKVPTGCFLEINNRYIWKAEDYISFFTPHLDRFRFVIGSDAHKPNWLNQTVAKQAAQRLGIREHLIFEKSRSTLCRV